MGSALGQAHWPPPRAGATSGRWPSVPGVTHLIARAQMGPIRTPGGPPNPRGRVPHQRCSRALVTPPPPVGPCIPSFFLRGADPGPLLCPLAPAMSRLRLLPVPALACWCPWLLALCFFFFFSHCLLAALALSADGRRRRGRGGGGFSLSSLLRKHVGSTAQARGSALVPPRGGGGVAVWPPSSPYPSCGCTPGGPPVGACTARAPLGHGRLAPLSLHPAAASPGGGPPPATVIPLVPSPSPRCPRLCPWWVREVGARGGGGAPSLPFLRRKHVAGTALARGTALVLLLGCEARRVALVFALSTLRALPRCPPRWRGGAAARPSLPATPTLGGAEACGGGGLVVFLPLPSRRRHEAWLSSLCRGGGGLASRLHSSPLLSYARTPGGPPAGACTERALYGHGRVARLALSFLCLPSLPRCPRGGGGGRFSPPPFPHSPSGGWWWWGGVGRPFRLPSVARTSQACRRHSTTTGRGTWLPRGGGGGFPLGLPALLHGKGPALQDHQPLLPPRR